MRLSPQTLLFFQDLLTRVSLPANIENFDEQAAVISTARKELAAALTELPGQTEG